MFHRRSSSASGRYFRPSLESLEERNLLSSAAYTNFLQGLNQEISSTASNVNQLFLALEVDQKAFAFAPHDLGALIKLETDCEFLLGSIEQIQPLTHVFSDLVLDGEVLGLVTNNLSSIGTLPPTVTTIGNKTIQSPNPGNKTDTEFFDALAEQYQKDDSLWQSLETAVVGQMVQALMTFLSVTGDVQPLPTSVALAAAIVAPSATESIEPAPTDASATGGPITESVTVNNPGNSDIHMAINYVSTDGSSASTSDDCTNSTITLPLQVQPSAAGNTGTWTVSVTGEPTQTNTTTWTA